MLQLLSSLLYSRPRAKLGHQCLWVYMLSAESYSVLLCDLHSYPEANMCDAELLNDRHVLYR